MKIINQSYEILTKVDREEILNKIEDTARVCYKSEDKKGNKETLVKMLVDKGHHAMLEHVSITIKFITNRGITHEIVRHRMASYAQESTRYCNYSKDKFNNELTFIKPILDQEEKYHIWEDTMACIENSYFSLLKLGASPQEARGILPNDLKTELVMTANLREWMHFFSLRTDKTAHPQIRTLIKPLQKELNKLLPEIFKC